MHGLPYHLPPITGSQVTAALANGGWFQGKHGAGTSYWQAIDVTTTKDDGTDKYDGLWSYNAAWDATSAANVSMTEENKTRLSRMFRRLCFSSPTDVRDLARRSG